MAVVKQPNIMLAKLKRLKLQMMQLQRKADKKFNALISAVTKVEKQYSEKISATKKQAKQSSKKYAKK